MRPVEKLAYRPYRNEEARFDAMVEDMTLRDAGVIEDDQTTEYSHYVFAEKFNREAFGEFTEQERAEIRRAVGLGPFVDSEARVSLGER